MKKSLYLHAVVIATVFVLFFCLVVTASAFATDLVITVTDYRAGENDRYISICVTGQDLHFFRRRVFRLLILRIEFKFLSKNSPKPLAEQSSIMSRRNL